MDQRIASLNSIENDDCVLLQPLVFVGGRNRHTPPVFLWQITPHKIQKLSEVISSHIHIPGQRIFPGQQNDVLPGIVTLTAVPGAW